MTPPTVSRVSDLPPSTTDGQNPTPLSDEEAEQIYAGLMDLMRSYDDPRLRRLAQEVIDVVAQGEPSVADVNVGRRKRERVLQVRPLTPTEELQVLVDAIFFTLITPVDLAASARTSLITEAIPDLDLVFERDVAVDSTAKTEQPSREPTETDIASETVTGSDIAAALETLDPLRSALTSIREAIDPT